MVAQCVCENSQLAGNKDGSCQGILFFGKVVRSFLCKGNFFSDKIFRDSCLNQLWIMLDSPGTKWGKTTFSPAGLSFGDEVAIWSSKSCNLDKTRFNKKFSALWMQEVGRIPSESYESLSSFFEPVLETVQDQTRPASSRKLDCSKLSGRKKWPKWAFNEIWNREPKIIRWWSVSFKTVISEFYFTHESMQI